MIDNNLNENILCFQIDQLKIGLYLAHINRVIRSVEISPLPGAPRIVLGIINLGGEVIPVINFRKKFDLPEKTISINDKLIIVQIEKLKFALPADEVIGMQAISEHSPKQAKDLLPGIDNIVKGVYVLDHELVIVHDLHNFISSEEVLSIHQLLEKKESSK